MPSLSEWLYNAVISTEVRTLSRDYFRLRKASNEGSTSWPETLRIASKVIIRLVTLLEEFRAMCSTKDSHDKCERSLRRVRYPTESDSMADRAGSYGLGSSTLLRSRVRTPR